MLHAPLPQGRSRSDMYPVNMYVVESDAVVLDWRSFAKARSGEWDVPPTCSRLRMTRYKISATKQIMACERMRSGRR